MDYHILPIEQILMVHEYRSLNSLRQCINIAAWDVSNIQFSQLSIRWSPKASARRWKRRRRQVVVEWIKSGSSRSWIGYKCALKLQNLTTISAINFRKWIRLSSLLKTCGKFMSVYRVIRENLFSTSNSKLHFLQMPCVVRTNCWFQT